MEFRVHSAVVLAVAAAGKITAAATDSSSRYDGALDASKSWGDARLLTSICLATE